MAPKKQSPNYGKTPINSVQHGDKRANIPTEELRGFVAEDEKKPTKVLYPRDPSLDPQLVWQGKDEQDSQDLEVLVVPIYIQEKIYPHAIVEDFRAQMGKKPEQEQLDMFAHAFEDLDFSKQIEFYEHEQNWANRMILGDSLLVMNSLAEKERLRGKVQMIYLDPPYGIKFGSNWQVSTRKRDVKDGKLEDISRQPEQIRAFRDTWEKGIHSYLAYLRDRLVVARELLTETGSICVQIGDDNLHLVRCLMDEVFGADNFVGLIAFNKTSGAGSPAIGTLVLAQVCDFIIWYAKDSSKIKYRQLYKNKIAGEEGTSKYRALSSFSSLSSHPDRNRLVTLADLTSQGDSSNQNFIFRNKTHLPPAGLHWKTTVKGLEKAALSGRITIEGKTLRYVRFLDDFPAFPINNVWLDIGGIQSRTDPKVYVVQTATSAIQRCILMTTDPGDLVLDPTCGSGTTAYVAEQWGRRWITIDTSRVALALARTRLMSAKFPYYLLADSAEGRAKEAEITGIPQNVIHASFGQSIPQAAESRACHQLQ